MTVADGGWVAALDRIVSRDVSRPARVIATVAGFAIALALAVLDYASGAALSFDAFYVLLVVVMTVVGGHIVGPGRGRSFGR